MLTYSNLSPPPRGPYQLQPDPHRSLVVLLAPRVQLVVQLVEFLVVQLHPNASSTTQCISVGRVIDGVEGDGKT